jgi:hypothetical protein
MISMMGKGSHPFHLEMIIASIHPTMIDQATEWLLVL